MGTQLSSLPVTSPLLSAPLRLEAGSIVTVRMPGHVRSPNHAEYFAPAVVLSDSDGETVPVLVWDSSAGTHYNHAYAKRELSSRGNGPDREVYEVKSNIGAVLYSPDRFNEMTDLVCELQAQVLDLRRQVQDLTACIEQSAKKA